nr:hypothetical protein [Polycyclovorans algicola]
MSLEGQLLDKNFLRSVTGKSADWNEPVKDCVAFANATGGRLPLGIEDGHELPSVETLQSWIKRWLEWALIQSAGRYPDTKMGDLHRRVGAEIPRSRVRRAVEQLVKDGELLQKGGAMAHATASPDLAQKRPYPPSLNQINAPNGPTRTLTIYSAKSFALVHKRDLSQSAFPRAQSKSLRPASDSRTAWNLGALRTRQGKR